MKRNLKQEMINKVDISKLMRHFKTSEIAFVFGVTEDYVSKTDRLQRIIIGEEYDEMKLGQKGAWTRSKERNTYKQWTNENFT